MITQRSFTHGCLLGLVLAVGNGCANDEPVPATPTWFDDVQPILQGNCFNCHGATARKTARTMRWDVCALTAFAEVGPFSSDPLHADPTDPEVEFIGARTRIPQTFTTYVQPHGAQAPLMPPAPAAPMTEHQVAVIAAWIKNPACGRHAHNAPPTATWLGDDRRRFAVADLDGDQVLGTAVCAGGTFNVMQSGATSLPAAMNAPCRLDLSDGQDVAHLDLP